MVTTSNEQFDYQYFQRHCIFFFFFYCPKLYSSLFHLETKYTR